jgi:transposase
MARYKPYDYGQSKLRAVCFDKQVLPGTFEYTVHRFIDEHVDLKPFAAHYRNDRKGARAYDPAILLKIVLFAYSRGITRSREIAELARENVVCMALSADTVPHFTTIADFVARLHRDIVSVVRDC